MTICNGSGVYHFAFGIGKVTYADDKKITVDFPSYELKRSYTKSIIGKCIFGLDNKSDFVWYFSKQRNLQNIDIMALCLKDQSVYHIEEIGRIYYNYAIDLAVKDPSGVLIRDIIYMLDYMFHFCDADVIGAIYNEILSYDDINAKRNALRSSCEIGNVRYFEHAAYELMCIDESEIKVIGNAIGTYNVNNDEMKEIYKYYRKYFKNVKLQYYDYILKKQIERQNEEQREKEEEARENSRFNEWRNRREIEFLTFEKETRETLKNRGIENLIHFTNVLNLQSIIEHGIVPRAFHGADEIESYYNDYNPIARTSLSVEFPNYMMMKSKASSREVDFAILLIDANVLLDKEVFMDEKSYSLEEPFFSSPQYKFYKDNASRSSSKIVNSLDEMFPSTIKPKYRNVIFTRERLGVPNNYTTSPQAEITTFSTIPVSYIRAIVFENTKLKEDFLHNFNNIPSSIDLLVADDTSNDCKKYFSDRIDAEIWREYGGYYY